MTGAALLLALSLRVGGMPAESASASPRIEYLATSDFENEFGCVGVPVGSTHAVLGWSSTLVVMKLDGAVLRFEPQKTSTTQTGSARLRQEWRSGPVSASFDLVRTGGDESYWEGDLTVRARSGADAGSSKTIRIRIDCGC